MFMLCLVHSDSLVHSCDFYDMSFVHGVMCVGYWCCILLTVTHWSSLIVRLLWYVTCVMGDGECYCASERSPFSIFLTSVLFWRRWCCWPQLSRLQNCTPLLFSAGQSRASGIFLTFSPFLRTWVACELYFGPEIWFAIVLCQWMISLGLDCNVLASFCWAWLFGKLTGKHLHSTI